MGLKRFYQRQKFYPGKLGLFLNPFYFARKGLHEQIRHMSRFIKGKTLDMGCGTRPYEECFESSLYIGLEINAAPKEALSHADVRYDGYRMPFKDNTFDAVLAFEVLEHVFKLDILLKEVRRILKPQGTVLLTVPFLWKEHETPNDFARYSSFGLRFLLEKEGFQVLKTEKTMAGLRTALQLLNAYLYNRFSGNNRVWNLFITVFMVGPLNLLGALLGRHNPKNSGFYLDNVFLCRLRPNGPPCHEDGGTKS